MSDNNLVVIHVSAIAQQDKIQAFEEALHAIVRDAAAMEGCLRYEWYRVPDEPAKYAIYGEFDSEQTFERYRQSEIVKRIGSELIPRLVEKPGFRHYLASVMETS